MSQSKNESAPVKVLIITSGFAIDGPLGGIERFGLELSKNIDRSKISITLLGMWAYGVKNEEYWLAHAKTAGVSAIMPTKWVENSPIKSFYQCLQDSRSILNGQTFDIIHSHCQFGDILAIALKRHLKAKKLLRTVHNEKEWPKRRLRWVFLTNLLLPILFDGEYGVSEKVTQNLNSRPISRIIKQPVGVLNNALNTLQMDEKLKAPVDIAALKKEFGFPAESRVIGSVGRLVDQKGFTYLIDAAIEVCQSFPDVYFLVVGDGPLKGDLEKQSAAANLNGRFVFAGPRSDIEAIYNLIDIFVSSSLWEGLPTVIMESLYAEIPVVATRVSGNVELVLNEETGILVNPKDSDSLKTGILRMLSLTEKEMYSLRRNGKEHITNHFTFVQIATKHETIYQESLSGSG
jgi:glycosyltransferase involved in cell wall biosynthesis